MDGRRAVCRWCAGDEAGMETFEDFGYEAEDFLDPVQVADYEQSETPVALTRPDMRDARQECSSSATSTIFCTLTTFADVPTVDDRVHRSRVAGRTLTVHAAEASTAAEVAARQERTEIQRLEYLRAQTTNCEAELEHLINVGAQEPNIAQTGQRPHSPDLQVGAQSGPCDALPDDTLRIIWQLKWRAERAAAAERLQRAMRQRQHRVKRRGMLRAHMLDLQYRGAAHLHVLIPASWTAPVSVVQVMEEVD